MVANELDRTGEPVGSTSPNAIEAGVPVTIEHIDTDAREIAFSASSRFSRSSRYESWHRGWTTDPTEVDDYTVLIEEETVFVLDPQTDDVNGQRAFDALSGPGREANALRGLLDDLATGALDEPTVDTPNPDAIESYLDWLDSSPGLSPNAEQQAFVRETNGQISLLQGPPGTGKTGGALAPAILARVLAFGADDRPFAGLVVGESHKAVDEVAADVASAAERHRDDFDAPGSLDDLDIVRLREAAPGEDDSVIEYLDYHDDPDRVEEIAGGLLSAQQGPQRTFGDLGGASSATDTDPLLVFATPGRLYGLMGAIGRAARDASSTSILEEGRSFFDLLAVDEASMMRLPSFLLCGAFVHNDAQILVAGDHRQMPPVRLHDWDREDRRTIEEFAPYCSALEFFRLLRGEAVAGVESEDLTIAREADLPVTRLEETYRCHATVADFLSRHIYRHDRIDYRSEIEATLDGIEATNDTDGLAEALDSAPLTLVLHEESESQQANPTEAELTAAIAAELDEVGVVTPHNAQKGLLGSRLEEGAEVDTVERFQGDERESIVVSATASDPDFLEAERDFILNPNRLTVAMSRMRKKLVVVASESVFEVVPPDTEGYERARLWKGLYEDLDVLDRDPEWHGTVGEFTDDADSDTDTSGEGATGVDSETGVAVYSLGGSSADDSG
jgi:SpoVK/Ycf46/Vps4 family AAA+-type ATPase